MELNEKGIEDVSLGRTHSMVITHDRSIWSWGSGLKGKLGISVVGEDNYMLP